MVWSKSFKKLYLFDFDVGRASAKTKRKKIFGNSSEIDIVIENWNVLKDKYEVHGTIDVCLPLTGKVLWRWFFNIEKESRGKISFVRPNGLEYNIRINFYDKKQYLIKDVEKKILLEGKTDVVIY